MFIAFSSRLQSRIPSGEAKIDVTPDKTVIKWTIGESSNVHSFVVGIDGPDGGSAQGGGLVFENFRFGTGGLPITQVQQGVVDVVTVHADFQLWNGRACPSCFDILTVGIDKPSDCIIGGNPLTYPGVSALDAVFQVHVPPTPGVYPIRTGTALQYDCDAALKGSLSDTQVGILVVTP